MFQFGANLSGFAFLYIDLVLITTLSVTCKSTIEASHAFVWNRTCAHGVPGDSVNLRSYRTFFCCCSTVGHTEAYSKLAPRCPQVSLLSLVPIVSIVLQISINFLVQLFVWFNIQTQPWYEYAKIYYACSCTEVLDV